MEEVSHCSDVSVGQIHQDCADLLTIFWEIELAFESGGSSSRFHGRKAGSEAGSTDR